MAAGKMAPMLSLWEKRKIHIWRRVIDMGPRFWARVTYGKVPQRCNNGVAHAPAFPKMAEKRFS
jgi:hypothetical protein